MAKRKTRGPKVDKYQTGSDEAQAARKQLDKKHEPRQAEMNRSKRSSRLLASALTAEEQLLHQIFAAPTEHQCELADWECDLVCNYSTSS